MTERHASECAHVVEPVGHFDGENLGLVGRQRWDARAHLVKHELDCSACGGCGSRGAQTSHFLAELCPQLCERVCGVFKNIVQQRDTHRTGTEPEGGDDPG